jgi:hypothetical protein
MQIHVPKIFNFFPHIADLNKQDGLGGNIYGLYSEVGNLDFRPTY